MFSVHIRMTARVGQRDALIERLKDMEAVVGEASEVLVFGISAPLDNPDAVLVTHIWTDRAAHDTTTGLDEVRAASARVVGLLAEPPTHAYADVAHLRAHRVQAGD